ncbi:hypothetical protein HAX54_027579, partial [Datura stramonium]|nr:hypothetical protein [Datura stramonium]
MSFRSKIENDVLNFCNLVKEVRKLNSESLVKWFPSKVRTPRRVKYPRELGIKP